MVKQGGPRGFELVDDPKGSKGEAGAERELVPGTFATFLLSLSTSALMHLGVPAGGEEGPPPVDAEVDLPLARQTIDILEMLREKTQGNLDAEEERLFDVILHDLRLRYVEAKRS